MNTLDIILIVPIAWGLIRGFMKGFIIQLAGIAAFLIGIAGAVRLSNVVAGFMEHHSGWNFGHVRIISFALTFLMIILLVFFLARLMEKAVKMAALGALNKIAGALFGALKFMLITGILLYLVSLIENSFQLIPPGMQKSSVLYPYYMDGLKLLMPAVRNFRSG